MSKKSSSSWFPYGAVLSTDTFVALLSLIHERKHGKLLYGILVLLWFGAVVLGMWLFTYLDGLAVDSFFVHEIIASILAFLTLFSGITLLLPIPFLILSALVSRRAKRVKKPSEHHRT